MVCEAIYFIEARLLTLTTNDPMTYIYSAVPPGSIVGPLLFLIFLNDFPDALKKVESANVCRWHRHIILML